MRRVNATVECFVQLYFVAIAMETIIDQPSRCIVMAEPAGHIAFHRVLLGEKSCTVHESMHKIMSTITKNVQKDFALRQDLDLL